MGWFNSVKSPKLKNIKKVSNNTPTGLWKKCTSCGELLQTSKFNDWILISLYYSLYHTFLALVQNKGYSSKNHNATIVFILKHYVQIEINELKLLEKLYISEEDAKFYMNLKETRKKANYSTELNFENSNIDELIEKVKEIHL